MPVSVEYMDQKAKLLKDYMGQLEFDVLHTFSEKIKKTKDGKVKDFTDDDKLGVGLELFNSLKQSYSNFTGISASNDFGKYSLELLFQRNCNIDPREFMNLIKDNFGLAGLANVYTQTAPGIESALKPGVMYGVEETDIPSLSSELINESKERYNVDLDAEKMKKIEALMRVYLALRSNASPELFDKSVNEFKK